MEVKCHILAQMFIETGSEEATEEAVEAGDFLVENASLSQPSFGQEIQ